MAERQPLLNPAAFYSRVAGDYHQPPHRRFYGHVAAELLAKVPRDIKARSILEVGAGTGFATRAIRERFPEARITALEPAPEMLKRGKAEVPGADWVCSFLSDFPETGFDLVVASMSYHWLDAKEREKLIRIAAGGLLAVAVPVSGAGGSIDGSLDGNLGGNRALKKTLRRFNGAGNWPRSVRRKSEVAGRLERRFSEVKVFTHRLSEDYEDWAGLAASLHARGVFYALFDGRTPVAMADFISAGLGGGRDAAFGWDICLLLAGNP